MKQLSLYCTFPEVIQALELKKEEVQAVIDLYNGELQKQLDFDEQVRRSLHVPRISDLGAAVADPSTSGNERSPLVSPNLLTDYVKQQDIAVGQAFLRGLGLARQAAEIGHWAGCSLTCNFRIDFLQVNEDDQEDEIMKNIEFDSLAVQRQEALLQTISPSAFNPRFPPQAPVGTIDPRQLLRRGIWSADGLVYYGMPVHSQHSANADRAGNNVQPQHNAGGSIQQPGVGAGPSTDSNMGRGDGSRISGRPRLENVSERLKRVLKETPNAAGMNGRRCFSCD